MESFLHLHPIFEFYLTAYFGFIIAPEFLGRFLLERVPIYIRASHKNVIAIIAKSKIEIDECKTKIDNDEHGIKKTNLIAIINTQCYPIIKTTHDAVKVLVDKIDKDVDDILNAGANKNKEEEVKSKLAKTARRCYDKVFPAAALYSFIVLLLNGCHWASTSKNNESNFMGYISYFNAIMCIYFLSLIFVRRLFVKSNFIRQILSKYDYRYIYTIVITLFACFFSFFLVPKFNIPFIFHVKNNVSWTIFSCLLIGAVPMLIFVIELLKWTSRRYFEAEYMGEIGAIQAYITASISDVDVTYNDVVATYEKLKEAQILIQKDNGGQGIILPSPVPKNVTVITVAHPVISGGLLTYKFLDVSGATLAEGSLDSDNKIILPDLTSSGLYYLELNHNGSKFSTTPFDVER